MCFSCWIASGIISGVVTRADRRLVSAHSPFIATYLVVEDHAQHSQAHTDHIGYSHRISQHEQGETYHHNTFGTIRNTVRQWRDERDHRERDHIVKKIENAIHE